ncbi:hypothetical protein [Oceanobacillus bengalensis]|uniref:hypothetical protein n=1 Tax=Oceanobacillus bengalensis TaxID=1435466 RepID=UPI0015FEDF61|nr:hypothetical protein [Oceanobacillus bengalensis]
MFWLYILIPIVVIGGIAVYIEKKSGMSVPDEDKQKDKLFQVLSQNDKNTRGPGF